jgi:hypothetical protein
LVLIGSSWGVGRKLVIALALALVRILPVNLLGLGDPVDLANLANLANLVDLGNLASLVSLVGLAEPLSSALLLGSTADRAPSPCMLWNRRGKLIFHIDCKRRSLEGWDGNSIVPVLEP